MTENNMSRRTFLGTAALGAGAAASVGLTALGASSTAAGAANDTIRVGIVGPGGRGQRLMKEFFGFASTYNARLTAVCDIWSLRRDQASKMAKDAHGMEPKVYSRYDDLLADQEVDAVIIATADHQHGRMLKSAVEAGKDVYCEKPMANDLDDANAALAAVQRSDRVVAIGTQRRTWPKYISAKKIVDTGILGDIVKVDLTWNACSPYRWSKTPEQLAEVREKDLDWSAFLLGKSDRPFDPRIFRSFRLFKDFSSGIIDQWMSHAIDTVHYFTGEPYPRSAIAHGGIYKYRDYRENPDTLQVVFEYGSGDKKFLVSYGTSLINGSGRGARLQGTRGTMDFEHSWRISGDDVEKFDDRITEPVEVPDAPDVLEHMADWLDCVRRRDRAGVFCDAEAGYGHSVACVLATEAYWSGRKMTFHPARRELSSL